MKDIQEPSMFLRQWQLVFQPMFRVSGGGETANALLMAERRRRIAPAAIETTLQAFHTLPVITDEQPESGSVDETFSLAREYGLTVYDATYLELAIRRGSALATLDTLLARAAASMGVELLV